MYVHFIVKFSFATGSSSKGIGMVCWRFQLQVAMGTKIYLSKEKKPCLLLK